MPSSAPKDAKEPDIVGETYSPDEIRAAISSFTDLNWVRVNKAAKYFASRCGREWQELLNEALARSLEGRRNCPRSVAVPTFLGNVIRSIASEVDELDGHAPLNEELDALQRSPAGLTDLSKPSDPAASTMDAQKMYDDIVTTFDGDDTCKMLFEGTVDGIEGQELREFLELSQKDFDSKRRFVRRRLNSYAERNPHVR